ncbi:LOW QUALITY PROTEIN: hypothetical protein U9M48_029047 [Paspalum notatum var. saurae]|uniref:Reverse transcriptase/retrotransposon-derived protein RNase H-like domain-containing protein n=1 Tax=Paspalum notatum var. saurae TaxID=547442 RepID=A0AAQ3X1Z3_PASNO
MQHYGMISRPLTSLLKKGVQFLWTPEMNKAFQLLKQALVQAPILASPDFIKQFILETYASDLGIGNWSSINASRPPHCILSKPLSSRNQALSAYEKECMTILLAVDKRRSYLQHSPFIIRIDNRNLNYTIQYKTGVTNAAADVLSHYPRDTSVCAISACMPSWMESGYAEDPDSQRLLTELSLTGSNEHHLKTQGKKWLGNDTLTQQHVLEALHNSGVGGHSEIEFLLSLYGKNCSSYPDTKLIMSYSYHPQIDDQTEWLNQCLEIFLRCSQSQTGLPLSWPFQDFQRVGDVVYKLDLPLEVKMHPVLNEIREKTMPIYNGVFKVLSTLN